MENDRYRNYIADCLKYTSEGKSVGITYRDMIKKKPETRSADEIILETMKNAGLHFKED